MRKHYLFFTATLFFQFSYSQTEKLIHGKVLNEDFPVQGVKVINLNTEKSIISNNNGDFAIMAKPDDMLVFYELEYNYKRKQVTEKEIYDDNIVIKLEKKPVQLKEVVITKTEISVPIFSQAAADEINLLKEANRPKVLGVYDGTIPNGMDFVKMFKDVAKLFKKKKANKNNPKIEFIEIVTAKIDQSFFTKALNLKPEETTLFLEFCDADPKSITVLEADNVLEIMDFMFAKNEEFKKLKELKK